MFNNTLVISQESGPSLLTSTLGRLASSATSVLALAVHPFAAVTTTV